MTLTLSLNLTVTLTPTLTPTPTQLRVSSPTLGSNIYPEVLRGKVRKVLDDIQRVAQEKQLATRKQKSDVNAAKVLNQYDGTSSGDQRKRNEKQRSSMIVKQGLQKEKEENSARPQTVDKIWAQLPPMFCDQDTRV